MSAQFALKERVVFVAPGDGLVENRGIGRDPVQIIVLDHCGEAAGFQHAAVDVITPHALAGGVEFA